MERKVARLEEAMSRATRHIARLEDVTRRLSREIRRLPAKRSVVCLGDNFSPDEVEAELHGEDVAGCSGIEDDRLDDQQDRDYVEGDRTEDDGSLEQTEPENSFTDSEKEEWVFSTDSSE
jgi:hypothetical protein